MSEVKPTSVSMMMTAQFASASSSEGEQARQVQNQPRHRVEKAPQPAPGSPAQWKERVNRAEPPAPEKTQELAESIRMELLARLEGHDVTLRHHEESDAYVVEIRDAESGSVIFQIPPEDLVRIGARMKELLKETGVLVDSSS